MKRPVVHIWIEHPILGDAAQLASQLRGIADELSLDLVWTANGKDHDALVVFCTECPAVAPGSERHVVMVSHDLQDGPCPAWADHMISGRGTKGLKWALRFLAALFARPARRLQYGTDADTAMWFTPADPDAHRSADAAPLAVLAHGGFWGREVACDHMAPLAAHLSKQGWSVLNLEFQRGGDWAVSVDDIAAALARVPRIASELRIDPGRVVCAGHSSGAHLMHLALTRLGAVIEPRLFLSLAGLLDLPSARRDPGCAAAIGKVEARSLASLPDPAQHEIASPVLAIHGAADTTVPPDQPTRFRQSYRGTCKTLTVENCDHMDLIKPARPHWAALARTMKFAVQ